MVCLPVGEQVRTHAPSTTLAADVYLRHLGQPRYLQPALKRINSLISGYEFDLIDLYAMQNMCAYEVRHPF